MSQPPPPTRAHRARGLLASFRSWATIRFVLVGGLVAAWMFAAFAVLEVVVGLHPQVALVLSFASGLALHFALNRQWVFSSDGGYALHLTRQGRRYLVTVLIAYAFTALCLLIFSDVLGANPLIVYYSAAAVQGAVTFLVFRHWVFQEGQSTQAEPSRGGALSQEGETGGAERPGGSARA